MAARSIASSGNAGHLAFLFYMFGFPDWLHPLECSCQPIGARGQPVTIVRRRGCWRSATQTTNPKTTKITKTIKQIKTASRRASWFCRLELAFGLGDHRRERHSVVGGPPDSPVQFLKGRLSLADTMSRRDSTGVSLWSWTSCLPCFCPSPQGKAAVPTCARASQSTRHWRRP